MTHDLVVRGFDDETHEGLSRIANSKGVSINSIIKDAVDKWLKHQKEIPKKHYLVIYPDHEAMTTLLKSMDRLAKEADLFRCFCGPPNSPETELLAKLKWHNVTINPYYYSDKIGLSSQESHSRDQKGIIKYLGQVMANIAINANNKQMCWMEFLINDIARSSLKQTMTVEQHYDSNRLSGSVYCCYKTENLINLGVQNMVELFELHDQVFILKEDDLYKLHVTKENVHKLFLN